jgi:hypothetical protein
MSITKDEGKRILRPIIKSAYPKLGVVSTLGYDFIHGSSTFQGLGIPELFHLTYAKQIETLIDNLWKDSQTGHFMMMAIQEFMLEAGTAYQPFASPRNSRLSSRLSTSNTWVDALHQYTRQYDIKVTLPLPPVPMQRINDAPLMDILDTCPEISTHDLKDINICRIYKKIYFLSDVMTGDGTKFSSFAWNQQHHTKVPSYTFNPQALPNQRQWRAWTNAMHVLQQTITSGKTRKLKEWTVDCEEYFKSWDYFFHIPTQQLYHRQLSNEWLVYIPKPTKTRNVSFITPGSSSPLPPLSAELCRCTVFSSNTSLTLESFYTQRQQTQNIVAHFNISQTDECIKSLCASFSDSKWSMKHFESTQSLTKLFHDFMNGLAVFVGDGSYDDVYGIGAGACIAASSDGSEYIIVGGPTPGPIQSQSAYRSEVGTIVGMAILARSLSTITNSTPPVTVACDNDSALERPFLARAQISPKQKSADLVSLAHDLWTTSRLTPILTKVTGHADNLNRKLTLLEHLNCIVDTKAKEFLAMRPKEPITREIDTTYGFANISIFGEEITGTMSSSIQLAQSVQRSKIASLRHKRVTDETWQCIDHIAISRSSRTLSTSRKIFITKWIAKQLPVGSVLLQRCHRLHDTCPMCQGAIEDMSHLVTCPSQSATKAYCTGLEKLSSWMQQTNTDPVIHHHLLSVLSVRRFHPSASLLPYPCILSKREHYDAFKTQEHIGWKQFTEGLIAKQWAIYTTTQILSNNWSSTKRKNLGNTLGDKIMGIKCTHLALP